jgi:hypothetical protein
VRDKLHRGEANQFSRFHGKDRIFTILGTNQSLGTWFMSEEVGQAANSRTAAKDGAANETVAIDADDYNSYIECIDVFLRHFGRLGMCVAIAAASAALVFFSPVLLPPLPVLLKVSGVVLFVFSAFLSILIAGDTYVRLSQYIPGIKPKKYLNHQWMDRLLLWFLLILSLFIVITASVIAHAVLLR